MKGSMCKNSGVLFVLLLLAVSLVNAQTTGKIAGSVIDKASGDPLPGVNVVIEGMAMGAATDAEGQYFILNIPPGLYTLRAEMVGYRTVMQQDVRVSIQLTTTVDFSLEVEAISGEEVVVVATRPIVQPDISGSQRVIDTQEIATSPFIDVNNLLTNQVSMNAVGTYDDRPEIRGSSYEESLFIVDGVSQGDPITNKPIYKVNLDAIQEVSIMTGGFSARYGNLRSGAVNIVTKEGGSRISASANIDYSPPGLKHFGPMIFSHDSPLSVPYVNVWDASGNWDPTAPSNTGIGDLGNGTTYNDFFVNLNGWNGMAASESGPHANKPQELYARWLWRHRSWDSLQELKKLASMGVVEFAPGTDPDDMETAWHRNGEEPDYKIQATLGGPVPGLSKTNWFLSYDTEQMEYTWRTPTPVYTDQNFRAKVTSMITPNIKLQATAYWMTQKGTEGSQGIDITGTISNNPYQAHDATNKFWYPNCQVTGQHNRQIYGLSWTHTLSTSTFYDLKFNYYDTGYEMIEDLRNTAPNPGFLADRYPPGMPSAAGGNGVTNGAMGTETEIQQRLADNVANPGGANTDLPYWPGWENWESWAKIKIGDVWYDESPKGYGPKNWRDFTNEYRMESCNLRLNDTYNKIYDFSGLVTSQVNRYNLVEAGAEFRYTDISMLYEAIDPSVNGGSTDKATSQDYRGAFFLTDKLEFPGFIANLGARLDWLKTPEYPVLDFYGDPADKLSGPYSEFLESNKTLSEGDIYPDYNTYRMIPLKSKTIAKISPRAGVAHPISTTAKIFFNYGHMYQWEDAYNMTRINYNTRAGNMVTRYGNPYLEPPRTIAYEIGYEHNIANSTMLRITGYYKDITREINEIRFYPLAFGTSDYRIQDNRENGHFRDIRGIEAFLELRRGVFPYFSGWASFNYLSESGNDYGFQYYYEDPARQPSQVSGQVSSPDIRPIIKMNLDFSTPKRMGPSIGENFSLLGGINASLMFYWQRGAQFTWNPAGFPSGLVENNMRWNAYKRWDFRFTKDLFTSGTFRSVFYVDIRNLFDNRNINRFSGSQAADLGDIAGNTWAWDGHKWWKQERNDYMYSMGYTAENMNTDGTFNNTTGNPGDYGDGIDMPAFTPYTFLEKRDIWFGFKVYF
jgi:hypothetical protein